jgi:hypothetical protein
VEIATEEQDRKLLEAQSNCSLLTSNPKKKCKCSMYIHVKELLITIKAYVVSLNQILLIVINFYFSKSQRMRSCMGLYNVLATIFGR